MLFLICWRAQTQGGCCGMKTVQPISGRRLGELARLLEERGIDNSDFQTYLVQQPNELVAYIKDLKAINPFESEKVGSEWSYDHWVIPDMDFQANCLREIIPGFAPKYWRPTAIGYDPGTYDGIALIPTVLSLGLLWSIYKPHGEGYGQVFEKLAKLLEEKKNIKNGLRGQLGPKNIRLHKEVVDVLLPLEEDALRSGCNCLVLPLSFGKKYAGYSSRNCRKEALKRDELPFNSTQGSCLLMSMSDRLSEEWHLTADWPGDCYDRHDYAERWKCMTYHYFEKGQIHFHASGDNVPNGRCGPVVGFPLIPPAGLQSAYRI